MRMRQIVDGEQRRKKAILDRETLINSIEEHDDGAAIQLKYPDGRTTRRRFNVSQPFQHLVAFAGTDEMATEVFSLQPAMSPNAIYSNCAGVAGKYGSCQCNTSSCQCISSSRQSITTSQSTSSCQSVTTSQPVSSCQSITTSQPVFSCQSVTTSQPVSSCQSVTTSQSTSSCQSITTSQPVSSCQSITISQPVFSCLSVTTSQPVSSCQSVTTSQPVSSCQSRYGCHSSRSQRETQRGAH
ncbi:hypothetical protein CRUP_026188 [Coryphaenoides rupestris]|nr:hypothetical protein CRUP_026188 [Coryphaenoides rupestris]